MLNLPLSKFICLNLGQQLLSWHMFGLSIHTGSGYSSQLNMASAPTVFSNQGVQALINCHHTAESDTSVLIKSLTEVVIQKFPLT